MDNHYGTAEPYYFATAKSGTIFTLEGVKAADSPEVQQAFADVQADINELEALLYADDPDWVAISEIIEVDSFVKRYFIDELPKILRLGCVQYLFLQGWRQ